MFIRERRFSDAIHALHILISGLNTENAKLDERGKELGFIVGRQAGDISMLHGATQKLLGVMKMQDKKIINLIEIVRVLAKDSDKDLIIANTQDGTELSVGDFLDAKDLLPKVNEEFNIARFIKQA